MENEKTILVGCSACEEITEYSLSECIIYARSIVTGRIGHVICKNCNEGNFLFPNDIEGLITNKTTLNENPDPNYYTQFGNYEPRLVIDSWGLNYHIGTAVSYLARAKHKNDTPIEDYRKAIRHIEFEIENLTEKE